MLKLKKKKNIFQTKNVNEFDNKKYHKKFIKYLFVKKKKREKKTINPTYNFWKIRKLVKVLSTCKKETKILLISTRQNNIFAVLSTFKQRKVKKNFTSTSFQLKVTKKTLKFNLFLFLKKMFKKIKNFLNYRIILFLKVPKRFRKKIMKWWLKKRYLLRSDIFIIFNASKVFNGCRAKKLRRKKRLKFRSLKQVKC